MMPTQPMGATMRGQHERTVDMLETMQADQSLAAVLWFLHDSQTTLVDLKALAEIAQRRKV